MIFEEHAELWKHVWIHDKWNKYDTCLIIIIIYVFRFYVVIPQRSLYQGTRVVWGLWWWSLRKSANPQGVKNAKRSYSSILRSSIFPFHGSFIVVQNHSSFITFQRISLANVKMSFMYFKCISSTKNMMISNCETQAAPLRSVLEHSCEGRWMSLESSEGSSPWLASWLIAIVIVSPPIPGLTN